MSEEKKLTMSFDPHTIEHLGVKMYSVLPNAIAELIANSYDAESPVVHIILTDDEKGKSITVADEGIGMSFDEINDNFLRIGRKRRQEDNGLSPNGLRKVTGRKGLGKLAFFGIGDTIQIITKKEGECVDFTMKWNDIVNSKTQNYEPSYTIAPCGKDEHGTIVKLTNLKRKTGFDVESVANSLARLFDFFDDSFVADISLNGSTPLRIDKTLRYINIESQFSWNIPNVFNDEESYFHKHNIHGELIATEKPLKPGFRGITLYAHGRLVNAAGFFGASESSHFYSYLTGWIDVDFVDEQPEDIISTDRQSLNWDLPITVELQIKLKQLLTLIERDWRNKRKEDRQKRISEQTRVDVRKWYPTLPADVQQGVEKIVNSVVENSELAGDKQNEVVDALHTLIPEYAQYHWRHLHTEVQNSSYEDYKKEDFYRAVEEALKRYQTAVQNKSGSNLDGQSLMLSVFGRNNAILSVTTPFRKSNGSEFTQSTKENIEEGQKFMSAGMMSGVRNPIAHEEVRELKGSGLFTENDCLDMLSLLSHLFRRLDVAKK